ncbi:MAG: GntR family transcriptional regulator [Victivallales bacterium]
MKPTVALRERRSIKRDNAANELRLKIIGGEWKPGEKIPNRDNLRRMLKLSPVTIQKAMGQIEEDGFISSHGANGTYVVRNLPNLSNYGIVFPYRQTREGGWPLFWSLLLKEAEYLQTLNKSFFPIYYASDDRGQGADHKSKIIRDVESHCLAGLIFLSSPVDYMNTPVITSRNVQRVMVMSSLSSIPGIPSVWFDYSSLIDRALERFAVRGRKHIAVITPSGFFETRQELIHQWMASLQRHGLTSRTQWQLGVDLLHPQTSRHIVQLLMSLPKNERPDGLLIADENLVDPVISGLIDSNMRIPDDVMLIAHGTFTDTTSTTFELSRIGFDVRSLLHECVRRINEQSHKREPRPYTLLPAIFSDEARALPLDGVALEKLN